MLCHLYLQLSLSWPSDCRRWPLRVTITAHGKPTNQYISKTEHIQIPIRIELKPDFITVMVVKTKTDLLMDVLLVLTIMIHWSLSNNDHYFLWIWKQLPHVAVSNVHECWPQESDVCAEPQDTTYPPENHTKPPWDITR